VSHFGFTSGYCEQVSGEILAIVAHLGDPTSDLHLAAADPICPWGT
jgi:hypothetical protein